MGVSFACEEHVATITFARPPLNIVSIGLLREMREVLREARGREDARVIAIASEGDRAFSAGADIAEHKRERAPEMIEAFHGVLRDLIAERRPTVALLQGMALGGGLELALACDLVLASDAARVGQPEIVVGHFAPAASVLLPCRAGMGRALGLLLTGEPISAEDARAAGLLHRVFPAARFRDDARDFLARLASRSGPVLALAKRAALGEERERLLARFDAVEELYTGSLLRHHDAEEGVLAFLEKRAPEWKDR